MFTLKTIFPVSIQYTVLLGIPIYLLPIFNELNKTIVYPVGIKGSRQDKQGIFLFHSILLLSSE